MVLAVLAAVRFFEVLFESAGLPASFATSLKVDNAVSSSFPWRGTSNSLENSSQARKTAGNSLIPHNETDV